MNIIVTGDKTTTIDGNLIETYHGPKVLQLMEFLTSNITGDYNLTVGGQSTKFIQVIMLRLIFLIIVKLLLEVLKKLIVMLEI